ncbi:predicted GTPases [Xanthomonas oryzae pv. oryzae KACC 10331]|uniref:Predicted GTPases n=1 Tax=Xanthomonas oryzae pv. oryzae (strain KACC10331 / KXO85) TaxID=291331 RepID=Q5H0R0_XANOR|nr:predicted GTPases [Xanthomonas oryzae pv. oryzae KACC 10331]
MPHLRAAYLVPLHASYGCASNCATHASRFSAFHIHSGIATKCTHELTVVTQLIDRIAHIAEGGMRRTLGKPIGHRRRPTPRKFLDGGHIQIAVMEIALKARHLPMQEAAILADRVAAHRRGASADPLAQECHGLRFGLRMGDLAVEHALPKTRTAVLIAVPLVHRFQGFQRMRDGQFRPLGKHVQLRIGHDGGDLDNRIAIGIQAGHFQIDPDQSVVACKVLCHIAVLWKAVAGRVLKRARIIPRPRRSGRKWRLAALGSEVIGQAQARLGRKHATAHPHTVIVARVGQQVEHAAAGAGLGVACGEHHARDPRMDHRHRTHRARLQGDVERAADQAVIGQAAPGVAHRHDFGMRAGVVAGDIEVPTFAQHVALGTDDQRANRDLVMVALGTLGQVQGVLHPVHVDRRVRRIDGLGGQSHVAELPWRSRNAANAATVASLTWCSIPSASRRAVASSMPRASKKRSTIWCRCRLEAANASPAGVRNTPR